MPLGVPPGGQRTGDGGVEAALALDDDVHLLLVLEGGQPRRAQVDPAELVLFDKLQLVGLHAEQGCAARRSVRGRYGAHVQECCVGMRLTFCRPPEQEARQRQQNTSETGDEAASREASSAWGRARRTRAARAIVAGHGRELLVGAVALHVRGAGPLRAALASAAEPREHHSAFARHGRRSEVKKGSQTVKKGGRAGGRKHTASPLGSARRRPLSALLALMRYWLRLIETVSEEAMMSCRAN